VEVAVIDMWLETDREGGLEAIRRARTCESPPECIVLTAYGSYANIVKCMEAGAFSYVEKSGRAADDTTGLLITTIHRAVETRRLKQLEAAQEQIKADERIKQDLQRAYEIQQSLLPPGDLHHAGMHFSGYCRPAENVGGDYYDYFLLPDDRIGLLIGDVTGHGFDASLIMAVACSCRSTQTRIDPDVAPVMDALNRIVQTTGPDWRLMTACYLLIDPPNRRFFYANAGHHFPFQYRADTGKVEPMESTGLPLGVDADIPFPVVERSWTPGDTLVLFSDGIVEAENAAGDIFGEDRLQALVESHGHESPPDLKQRIIDAVETFSQGVPFLDDVTLVVAKL
jgi:sigma-B regulation protein RsbU (phosphoserine phosphatase)